MGGAGRSRQSDIVGCVAAREAMAPRGPRLDDTALAPAGDQGADPRQAESADLHEIAPHDPFVFFRQTQAALGASGAFGQPVSLLAAGCGEAESAAGGEKLSHLGQRKKFGMLHGELPSPAVCPVPAGSLSGSSCVGNTPPFQAHLVLDNSYC